MAKRTTKKGDVFEVAPEQIGMPDADHLREVTRVDAHYIARLAADMMQHGQYLPIRIKRKRDGTFDLVSGYRRVLAGKMIRAVQPDWMIKAIDFDDVLDGTFTMDAIEGTNALTNMRRDVADRILAAYDFGDEERVNVVSAWDVGPGPDPYAKEFIKLLTFEGGFSRRYKRAFIVRFREHSATPEDVHLGDPH